MRDEELDALLRDAELPPPPPDRDHVARALGHFQRRNPPSIASSATPRSWWIPMGTGASLAAAAAVILLLSWFAQQAQDQAGGSGDPGAARAAREIQQLLASVEHDAQRHRLQELQQRLERLAQRRAERETPRGASPTTDEDGGAEGPEGPPGRLLEPREDRLPASVPSSVPAEDRAAVLRLAALDRTSRQVAGRSELSRRYLELASLYGDSTVGKLARRRAERMEEEGG